MHICYLRILAAKYNTADPFEGHTKQWYFKIGIWIIKYRELTSNLKLG